MEIGASPPLPTPALSDASAAALSGIQDAQAQVAAASEQLAAGNLDPAVIVDIASAELAFAVNAKVMEASQDMTKRLVDMLA